MQLATYLEESIEARASMALLGLMSLLLCLPRLPVLSKVEYTVAAVVIRIKDSVVASAILYEMVFLQSV